VCRDEEKGHSTALVHGGGGGRREEGIPLRVRGTEGTLGANRFARLVFYPKERSLYFNEVILLHSSVPVSGTLRLRSACMENLR